MTLAPRLCTLVAVVTGGARGIGRAIAERFLAEGAAGVVLADLDAAQAEKTARSLGPRAVAQACDIRRQTEIDAVVRAAVGRFGRLDVWVNNAAHARYGFAVDLSEDDWSYTTDVTLKGTFLGAQAAARQMLVQGGGKIINISSVAAQVGLARTAAYAASKGGIDALTRVLAVELARDNIRVNGIAPGFIDTEFSRQVVSAEGRKLRRERTPVGELGRPADVAAAAAFLASADADWLTGDVIRVDGGAVVLGAYERRPAG